MNRIMPMQPSHDPKPSAEELARLRAPKRYRDHGEPDEPDDRDRILRDLNTDIRREFPDEAALTRRFDAALDRIARGAGAGRGRGIRHSIADCCSCTAPAGTTSARSRRARIRSIRPPRPHRSPRASRSSTNASRWSATTPSCCGCWDW